MGKKPFLIIILLMFCILFVSACSEKKAEPQSSKAEQAETPNEKDIKTEDPKNTESKNQSAEALLEKLPAPTKTVVELANAAPGPYAGEKYEDLPPEKKEEVLKEFSQLPKLGEHPSEAEIELYWRKSIALFHEDYPNPTELIEQVAIESFGNPEITDDRYQFKEQLNVQILLDSSGSMGNYIDGKTMMDIAKESIKEFADSLPEGANIALRVYGHKGSGSNKDKDLSCKSNELIYELQSYNPSALNDALSQIKPAGWTPLAKAIDEAKNDLIQYKSENNTNIIYLVSDGIETCGGDPIAEAKKLADSDIQPIVNVIGFDLDSDGQKQLKEVAAAAKGIYSNARNQEELKKELEKAQQIAEKWKEWRDKALTTASDEKWSKKISEIPDFTIKWRHAYNAELTNIRDALWDVYKASHISKKAYFILEDKTSERTENGRVLINQLSDELRQLADENFEKVKEEINKKYNDNTK